MKATLQIFNYQIVKNEAAKKADIFIDGDIVDASTQEFVRDWWGDETSVSYKSFRNELLKCGYTDVDIYVNSYGGHVGDAMAMHDLIQDKIANGWNINTYGRGMVCSSATYIVMAGKNGGEVSGNTSWLIHNVSGGIWGNVNEVENYATTLRKFNNLVVDFYANKTGMSKEVITDLMNKETWLIGQEIADKGFVKACNGATAEIKNAISPERWPFKNRAVLNTYNSSIQKPDNTMNKLQEMLESFKNEMKALFNSGKTNEELGAAVADKVTNLLTAADADRETAINNAVSEALKGEAFTNAVNEAVKGEAFTNSVNAAVTKALETVPANIQKAITDATAGLVDEKKFEKLIDNVADKMGKPGGPKNRVEDTDDEYEGIKVTFED